MPYVGKKSASTYTGDTILTKASKTKINANS